MKREKEKVKEKEKEKEKRREVGLVKEASSEANYFM